jgi:hypothetical protein
MNIRLLVLLFLTLTALLTVTPARTPLPVHEQADAAHTLSEAQKLKIKRIQIESEQKAAQAALRLAAIVNRIYDNMLADKPDEKLRARLSAEMKDAAWTLLAIKGQTVREIVNVLTVEQKQFIKSEMRKPGAPGDLSEVISRAFKLTDK